MSDKDIEFYLGGKTIQFGTWINNKNQNHYNVLQLVVNATNIANMQVMVMYQHEGSSVTFVRDYNEFHSKFTFAEPKYNVLDIQLEKEEQVFQPKPLTRPVGDWHAGSCLVLRDLSNYDMFVNSRQIELIIKKIDDLFQYLKKVELVYQDQYDILSFLKRVMNNRWYSSFSYIWEQDAINKYAKEVKQLFPELFTK